MKRTIAAAFLWLPLCAFGREPYSAQETIQRAEIGTHSQRLRQPEEEATPTPRTLRAVECYPDPAKRVPPTIVCEEKDQ